MIVNILLQNMIGIPPKTSIDQLQ